MKHEIPFRIIVDGPLDGVAIRVQKGKNDLLEPSSVAGSKVSFEFEITVDVDGDAPNFLGKFAQGPKDSRFVYVNSGTYAGQHPTAWGRRAKLSLMSITKQQVQNAIENGSIIETTMPGVGRDGGPTCASVKGLEWKVVSK
ncbi:MAG: hypothetical protein DMF63_17150 [Acidobacteria bacterium]|nr:MAG: hypothetical protein DMF63_17150 [Acidobacteriota bacterium]